MLKIIRNFITLGDVYSVIFRHKVEDYFSFPWRGIVAAVAFLCA